MTLLILTAPALALSRTATGASGVMVICTGSGPVSVVIDAGGAPVQAVHICPDCALSALGAVLPGLPDLPHPALRMMRTEVALAPMSCTAGDAPAASARGPPRDAPPPNTPL